MVSTRTITRTILVMVAALFCIASLVLPVVAATGRVSPTIAQPVVVNITTQPTIQVDQPARVIVVTTTMVQQRIVAPVTTEPQRQAVVTTVTTGVVNPDQRVMPEATTSVVLPPSQQVIVPPRIVNMETGSTQADISTKVVPAQKKEVGIINPSDIEHHDFEVTTVTIVDPQTGKELTENPGADLPGGKTINILSAEDEWENRPGAGGMGLDIGGTPFGNDPFSDPIDSFFDMYGGGSLDPFAAYGSSRPGYSSAGYATVAGSTSGLVISTGRSSDTSAQSTSGGGSASISNTPRMSTNSGEENEGTVSGSSSSSTGGGGSASISNTPRMSMNSGEENEGTVSSSSSGSTGGGGGGFMNAIGGGMTGPVASSTTDENTLIIRGPGHQGIHAFDQQYEGEPGYSGGGRSANDIMIGGSRRFIGLVIVDTSDASLGQDTGGKKPALFTAIENYVAKGGKVRGSIGGYQPGDSGQGSDIAGTQANHVTALKNALASQRFMIDPGATYAERISWWLQPKTSPGEMKATEQTQ